MNLLAALRKWFRSWFGFLTSPPQVHAGADLVDALLLQRLLKELAGEFRYMLLANAEARLFDRFDLSQVQDLANWPTGQVFGPKSELRWRPKRDKFAVCFVTDSGSLPTLFSVLREKETLKAKREGQPVRLWGEHTAVDVDEDGRPFWLEAQIPRLLRYPIGEEAPPIVALRTVRYVRDDGTVAFVRFVDVEAWPHG